MSGVYCGRRASADAVSMSRAGVRCLGRQDAAIVLVAGESRSRGTADFSLQLPAIAARSCGTTHAELYRSAEKFMSGVSTVPRSDG